MTVARCCRKTVIVTGGEDTFPPGSGRTRGFIASRSRSGPPLHDDVRRRDPHVQRVHGTAAAAGRVTGRMIFGPGSGRETGPQQRRRRFGHALFRYGQSDVRPGQGRRHERVRRHRHGQQRRRRHGVRTDFRPGAERSPADRFPDRGRTATGCFRVRSGLRLLVRRRRRRCRRLPVGKLWQLLLLMTGQGKVRVLRQGRSLRTGTPNAIPATATADLVTVNDDISYDRTSDSILT